MNNLIIITDDEVEFLQKEVIKLEKKIKKKIDKKKLKMFGVLLVQIMAYSLAETASEGLSILDLAHMNFYQAYNRPLQGTTEDVPSYIS